MKNKANVEIFKGFAVKYPEYEVITPQGNKSYTVRTMTVADEEKLKGSMITPAKVARHLAEVIWDCIVKKPDDIKTFDDFISTTTMKDRDALLYGLYVATYKNIQNYRVECDNPECGHTNLIKIDVEKSIKGTFWDTEKKGSVLDYRHPVPLKIFEGVSAILKSPTIKDEISVSEANTFATQQMTQMQMTLAMIEKFVEAPSEVKPTGEEYSDRDNILTAYNSLPSPDRKLIDDAFEKVFNECQIKVVAKMKCSRCQKEQDVEVDMTSQFFRALYE